MGAQADAMDDISTRTPHAGSDGVTVWRNPDDIDFNPHSPCGE